MIGRPDSPAGAQESTAPDSTYGWMVSSVVFALDDRDIDRLAAVDQAAAAAEAQEKRLSGLLERCWFPLPGVVQQDEPRSPTA